MRARMLHAGLLAGVVCLAAAASASAAAPNPVSNLPFSTPPGCSAPISSACENAAVAELDSAHAALGLPAYTLPADFDSLAPADQLLILSNLDRIAYGLTPISGLSPALDAAAQVAVADDTDPNPGPDLPAGLNIVGWWSNWAGGYANAVLAYYGWMYDDGPGSPNLDCRSAGDPGCWGHRQDILAVSAPGGAMVMGADAGTDPYGEPGYALTIVGTETASTSWTTLNYTWAQALADTAGSGSSGTAGAGAGSGSTGSGSSSSGSGSGAPSTGASGPTGAGDGSGAGASGSSGPTGRAPGGGSAGSSGNSGRGGSSLPTTPPAHAPTPDSGTRGAAPITVIARTHVSATSHVASFVLRASGAASGFQCALVRRSGDPATTATPRYGACGAVRVYRHLATGLYTFYARALDRAGTARKPARHSFAIG